MENRRRLRRVVVEVLLWTVTLFLVWVFARQGLAKFSDSSGWARAFRVWHYPAWFRVGVGVAETAAAVLLLSKRTATAGALIIVVVMLGGMATHVWWRQPAQVTSEVLPLLLAGIVAIGRHKSFGPRRRTGTAS